MGMSGPSAPPPPPDPVATAAAQSKTNLATANANYGLNATNQVTPQGSLTYQQVGTWPDGTPHFQATQSLSPEQQGLYNQYTNLAQGYGKTASTALGNVSGMLGTPFNVDTATADKISGLQKEFLDPQWNAATEQNNSQLANQGITPGSQAYDSAMRNFGDSKQRAYDQMYLDSYGTGMQSALTQRNQPLSELSTLTGLSKSGEQNPSYVGTPQSNMQSPDLAGMTYQSYQMGPLAQWQQQQQYRQAMMGGLFGLGGAALGGGARIAGAGGFGNPFGIPGRG